MESLLGPIKKCQKDPVMVNFVCTSLIVNFFLYIYAYIRVCIIYIYINLSFGSLTLGNSNTDP